ncbi:ATPase [Neobacillus notoginsengisoli]|uniref:ATPase n=1 Tax=Neobacillus notoginsengisoli TaxID=1578198 RepID=A0A417YQ88_9BACI|nr:BadF/BadG/BcrA/BcrD ATPase family protein [Neobacillus notoginsengisoli]RHW35748.1 ATPase [Neobacillus notoginsengisoli]
MAILMGVDGGGTKTFTVISDEYGNLLGSGISGCGNHQVNGIEQTLTNIHESIESALSGAKLKKGDIDFVQFGLAGADREKDFKILRPALGSLSFPTWDVVCDTMEGLRTGSPTNTGVVLVCGTGTNAAGRNKAGKVIQTGGFGYLYGDFAGGSQMAVETFRAAVRSWEKREQPSILVKEVPAFFNFSTMEELINSFLDTEVYEVPSELTEVLHKAADEGDPASIKILMETGRELGLAANSVIERLGDLDGIIPIVLTGSVLQKGRNKYLLDSIEKTISNINPDIKLCIPDMEPVYGSILLAMDHLDIVASIDVYKKFESYGGYKKWTRV